MTLKLENLRALEILDSRGNPTLAVEATLSNGSSAWAHVPSGASTGRHEALELRDGDPARYGGKGVLKAAGNVAVLLEVLRGLDAEDQAAIDHSAIDADGTPNKSRLGANAILGVSCAVARAVSVARREPLWKTLAGSRQPLFPVPMVNIFSGGLHAGHNIEFQDFLIVPHGFDSYAQALEATVKIHRSAYEIVLARGYLLTGVADEGGWGPRLESNVLALELLTEAIARAGFEPGAQVSIAVDVASTHFFENGAYHLKSENRILDSAGMISLLEEWCARFPIVSIEDGLMEDDWEGWTQLTARLGGGLQLVGDDFFTTNPKRVERGIQEGAGNAVLVKMNQIGTLTETFQVIDRAREAGFRAVISARSGETEDSFLADLATASGAGQIKVGSITRSERLAKYNRLLELDFPYPGRRMFPSA
jgi:enolase